MRIGVLMVVALFVFMALGYIGMVAHAKTIYVPNDYGSIQEAINAAEPGDTIVVRAGVYVESVVVNKSGLIIISEGGVVVRSSGADTVFNVMASNVSIVGFTIMGGWDGIWLHPQADRCVIVNNTVVGNYHGVVVQSSYNVIRGNTISNNVFMGIDIVGSRGNLVVGNRLVNNSDGISILSDSINNTILGNEFVNNTYGLFLGSHARGNAIVNNSFTNDGLAALGPGNYIRGNVVNGKPLIYLEGVANVVVHYGGQVIIINSRNVAVTGLNVSNVVVGVLAINVTGLRVMNNTIVNARYGMELINSSYVTVANNRIIAGSLRKGIVGVDGAGLSHCSIIGNDVRSYESGVYLDWVNKCVIGYNRLVSDGNGIEVYDSRDNVIIANEVLNSSLFYGIAIGESTLNTVVYNKVVGTEYVCGIELLDSYNNTLYLNSIIGTEQSVCVDWLYLSGEGLTNTWHSPNEIEYVYGGKVHTGFLGNYWGDHGVDKDGDGVADSPYVVDENNVDYYPLVAPAWYYGVIVEPGTYYTETAVLKANEMHVFITPPSVLKQFGVSSIKVTAVNDMQVNIILERVREDNVLGNADFVLSSVKITIINSSNIADISVVFAISKLINPASIVIVMRTSNGISYLTYAMIYQDSNYYYLETHLPSSGFVYVIIKPIPKFHMTFRHMRITVII
ncbi:MAG: NosD domain-containing protein [Vulcanisaeta sp.]|uniref:NosD domain-containing protein n=1 Tax=Vulcanisaeta sp. TaxID=2020871 RepID=UPI003D0F9392